VAVVQHRIIVALTRRFSDHDVNEIDVGRLKVAKMSKSVVGVVSFVAGVLSCALGMFLLLQAPDHALQLTRYKGSSLCGLAAVVNICRMWGIPLELGQAYRRAAEPLDDRRGISLLGCKRALEASGVGCEVLRFRSIGDLPGATPILLTLQGKDRLKDRLHAVAVVRDGKRVLLIDGHNVYAVTSDYVDKQIGNIAIVTTMVSNSDKERILCPEE
jgi:hypothetical protein